MSEDFLEKQMRETTQFQTIVNTYTEKLMDLPSLNDIWAFLGGVLEDYHFKRDDNISIYNSLRGTTIKQRNGYFLAKTVLLEILQRRIRENRELQFSFTCQWCMGTHIINLLNGISYVDVHPADSRVLLDFTLRSPPHTPKVNISINVDPVISKMIIRESKDQSLDLLVLGIDFSQEDIIHYFPLQCTINPVLIPQEPIQNRRTEKTLDGNQNSQHQRNLALNSKDRAYIQKELRAKLSQEIPVGKYRGKTFLWLISFDLAYITTLVNDYDHEDELLYFFKEVYSLGKKVEFMEYEELASIPEYISL